MTGKSQFILRLVIKREHIFQQKFERIIHCTPKPKWDGMDWIYDKDIGELKEAFPELEVIRGLPNIKTLQTQRETLVSTTLYELKPMTK